MQIEQTRSTENSSTQQGMAGLTTSSDMFMKLLTAQLKAQDPISPMNPNEFVGQLVQFNTLGQIMEIRGVLEQIQQAATAAATSEGEK
jgi:flagellar basal-body rod modification protein FlgD